MSKNLSEWTDTVVLEPYVLPIFVEGYPGILYWHAGMATTTVRVDSAACTRSVRSLARQGIALTTMTVAEVYAHDFTIKMLTDVFVRQAA